MNFLISLVLISALSVFTLSAQLTDDFSDGNFDQNPEWFGNTGSFIINSNKQLQLDTAGSGVKYLVTENNLMNHTEWSFWIKLNFDPSANNQVRIYLTSDKSDLTNPLNGYFIRIGENLALDDIDLIKQSGTSEQIIIDGIDGRAAIRPTLRIKVLRDNLGNWQLFSDTTGGFNFIPEGTGFDSSFITSSFFGIHCKFTSSNAKNFFFDDFYIGKERKDTTAPKIIDISTLSLSKLILTFDENIDNTGINENNFRIIQGTDSFKTNKVEIISKRQIIITPEINNNYKYNFSKVLQALNIPDSLGNKGDQFIPFIHYLLLPGDIVINEFMADPAPVVSLPDAEFVEIYNTLNIDFPLKFLRIEDPLSQIPLSGIIPAGSYLILCKTTDTSAFKSYGKTLGINLPSLNNSGDKIILRSAEFGLIDSIQYDLSWYKDPQKSDGGWSLERIYPYQHCFYQADNFTASVHPDGGSPGRKNSVYDTFYLKKINKKFKFYVLNDTAILVETNFKLNTDSASGGSVKCLEAPYLEYKLKPEFTGNSLIFYTDKKMLSDHSYSFSFYVYDCKSQIVKLDSFFIIPGILDSSDLIINEVLFNPLPYSNDFIEIYNRSDKYLNLKNLKIASLNDSLQLKDIKTIFTTDFFILPNDYLVITENPDDIKTRFWVKNPEKMVKTNLITMPDDKGDIVLLSENKWIDYFHYEESYHFQALTSKEGISLERISPEAATNNPSNWYSASSSAGYATPTYKNSQFSEIHTADSAFLAEPKIFSPDGDGFNDILKITYKFNNTGNFGSIKIYDLSGRLVKDLVNNDLFGNEGFYIWDGMNENGTLCLSGVYIIYAEVINIHGKVKKYKLSCTLVR